MKNLKQWGKYLLFQVIIPNIIWFVIISIPSAITGLIFFVKAIIDYANNQAVPTALFVTQVVAAGICILTLIVDVVYLIYRLVHRRNHPVFPKLESEYKITHSEQELFFRDREHIAFRQHVDFVSLKNDLRHFDHTYYWTGQKYVKSTLINGSERGIVLTDSIRNSSPYNVTVDYPRAINYNQADNYSLETIVEDANRSMIPHLCKMIKCSTKSLKLKVTAPVGLLQNAQAFVSTDYQGDIILDPKRPLTPSRVGDNEVFEYEWQDLDLLHCYTIAWEFAKNG